MLRPSTPAAVTSAATAAVREVVSAYLAADVAGRAPGTWAHLSQDAALEAALLVSLYMAAYRPYLLDSLGRGVEVIFLRM
jgi:hypothetical protein